MSPPVKLPATSMALLPPKKSWGPALLALATDAQRLFVVAYANPLFKRNATRCAEVAGYSTTSNHSLRNTGYQLLREPRVQAAIQEENKRYMNVELQTAAVHALGDILENDSTDPKLKSSVAFGTLDRSGMGAKTEHTVNVVQKTPQDDLKELIELAKAAGREDLLEKYGKAAKAAGVVIDAEFTEIPRPNANPSPDQGSNLVPWSGREGLEDILG